MKKADRIQKRYKPLPLAFIVRGALNMIRFKSFIYISRDFGDFSV